MVTLTILVIAIASGGLAMWAGGCGGGHRQGSGGQDLPTARPVGGAGPGTAKGRPEQPPVALGKARVTVTCAFSSGWAAALPRSVVDPRRDDFLMQALIGLREDPQFWTTESEYASLAPWAAQPCDGPGGASFEVPAGDIVVVVGQADTFDGRGAYQDNGAIRELLLHEGDDVRERFTQPDLVLDFSCISCPWLEVWDFSTATWQRRAEILVDLYSAARARSQRRAIGQVEVRAGLVRLRVAEDDDEVSHLEALTLELGGLSIRTPLPATTLHRGQRVITEVRVALPDGHYAAAVVASGYYTPLRPLR